MAQVYDKSVEEYAEFLRECNHENSGNFGYYGDLDPDVWGTVPFVGYNETMEDSALHMSNWEGIRDFLLDAYPEDVQVEDYRYWVGGIRLEVLRVNTENHLLVADLRELHEDLDNYPVYDEDHMSQKEMDIAEENFESWGKEALVRFMEENANEWPEYIDEEGNLREDFVEEWLFKVYFDSTMYHGEQYFSERSVNDALEEIRAEMRWQYEEYQPPIFN